MSELMTQAIIGMPYELAMHSEISRKQFYNRAQSLLAEFEGLRVALTECSDSLHGEMLQKFGGQLPDDMHPVTRRDYDRDMAEVAGYRTEIGGIEPTLDTPDELAGLRLDAGRYRWLRVKQTFIWLIQDWFPSDAVFTDVDAEIDAAMGRGEQS